MSGPLSTPRSPEGLCEAEGQQGGLAVTLNTLRTHCMCETGEMAVLCAVDICHSDTLARYATTLSLYYLKSVTLCLYLIIELVKEYLWYLEVIDFILGLYFFLFFFSPSTGMYIVPFSQTRPVLLHYPEFNT